MKESALELDCKKLANALGWAVYKGSGRNGAPDKIFLKDRAGFTAEMKRPGKKRSPDQEREAQYLDVRGVPCYLIDNLEDFRKALLIEENYLEKQDGHQKHNTG